MRQQLHSGMTVLELMITLALLGVLAAVAYPAYNGYAERARTNRAIGDVSRISVEIYRWRTNTGSASFPATLAAAGIAVGDDPWGNPYTYLRIEGASIGDVRKDKNLTPVNSDFDFYSNGPDGATAKPFNAQDARDDIVRANNGAFIGLAEEY
jgi:general secretion pathway protein G